MATRILLDAFIDGLGADVPVGRASLTATFSRPRTTGSHVVHPVDVTVLIVDGVLAEPFLLVPTGLDWYCTLRLRFLQLGRSIVRTVAIPDVADVAWGDLIDIDPATMQPSPEGVAAWAATLAEVAALIATISPGPAGADGAAGRDGIDGMNGINGTNGADGAQGPPGADGADGLPGGVQKVNNKTGDVVLTAADVAAIPTGTKGITPTTEPYLTLSNNGSKATMHLLMGEGFTGDYLIGIGNDFGNKPGMLIANKAQGMGLFINNQATLLGGAGYGLRVVNSAVNAPGASFQALVAGAATAVEMTAATAASVQGNYILKVTGQPGGTFAEYGGIRGSGLFIWNAPFRIDTGGFFDHRGTLNFFGAAGATGKTKQTVTGSLTSADPVTLSILAALKAYGLVTDGTTA